MVERRGILKGLLGLLLAAGAGRPAVAAPPARPGFRMVDGWILTERDLERSPGLRAFAAARS